MEFNNSIIPCESHTLLPDENKVYIRNSCGCYKTIKKYVQNVQNVQNGTWHYCNMHLARQVDDFNELNNDIMEFYNACNNHRNGDNINQWINKHEELLNHTRNYLNIEYDKLSIKQVKCFCGLTLQTKCLKEHEKSKYHIAFITRIDPEYASKTINPTSSSEFIVEFINEKKRIESQNGKLLTPNENSALLQQIRNKYTRDIKK